MTDELDNKKQPKPRCAGRPKAEKKAKKGRAK
jgi:hypothetical protein